MICSTIINYPCTIRIFFFLIGKEKFHIKRDAKKTTQGIQNLYIHRQKGQKRKKEKKPNWPIKQP